MCTEYDDGIHVGQPTNVRPCKNRVFKYEITTPLTPENKDKLTAILKRTDLDNVFRPGVMGYSWHGLIDSNGEMVCYCENELFDRPCESYRIYFGDFRKDGNSQQIAGLDCWFEEVDLREKIKSVRKTPAETQIINFYNQISGYKPCPQQQETR